MFRCRVVAVVKKANRDRHKGIGHATHVSPSLDLGALHLNVIKCASIDAAQYGYVESQPAIN